MEWKDIWAVKTISGNNITEEDIFQLNGYDTKYTTINSEKLNDFVSHIKLTLHIQSTDSVYEIGCGTGYFIKKFKTELNEIGGIDYSSNLIDIACKLYNDSKFQFKCCEASDYNIQSDFILSYSVFFYFKNYEYATEVLNKMNTYSNKGFALFDVPDIEKYFESENERENSIYDYKNRYKTLNHLYYSRNFFILYAEKNNLGCIIEDQHDHSSSSKFRFNVYFLKNGNSK